MRFSMDGHITAWERKEIEQLWILGLHQIEDDTDMALTSLNVSLISVACIQANQDLPQCRGCIVHSLVHILETLIANILETLIANTMMLTPQKKWHPNEFGWSQDMVCICVGDVSRSHRNLCHETDHYASNIKACLKILALKKNISWILSVHRYAMMCMILHHILLLPRSCPKEVLLWWVDCTNTLPVRAAIWLNQTATIQLISLGRHVIFRLFSVLDWNFKIEGQCRAVD